MKIKIMQFLGWLALAAVCAHLFSCGYCQKASDTLQTTVEEDKLISVSDSTHTACGIEPRIIGDIDSNFSPRIFDYRIYERKKDAEYVTRIRWQIDLKIPNAKDSIFVAIRRFSPEFQNWCFYVTVCSNNPSEWYIIGKPSGTRLMSLFLEEHFIETIGYLTIDGRDIEFKISHESGNFNDLKIDSLIEYTGMCKEYSYITNYPGVLDGCVEYHIRKTNQGLKPYQKIESW